DAHTTPRTHWRLVRGDLLEALARQTVPADIVYWDPFSPRANPTLWTVAAFSAARRLAGPRCTLYTYSASTATRLALLLAGWTVGVGDAIGDKAQTTAAAVATSDLATARPRLAGPAVTARRSVAARCSVRRDRAGAAGTPVRLRSAPYLDIQLHALLPVAYTTLGIAEDHHHEKRRTVPYTVMVTILCGTVATRPRNTKAWTHDKGRNHHH